MCDLRMSERIFKQLCKLYILLTNDVLSLHNFIDTYGFQYDEANNVLITDENNTSYNIILDELNSALLETILYLVEWRQSLDKEALNCDY